MRDDTAWTRTRRNPADCSIANRTLTIFCPVRWGLSRRATPSQTNVDIVASPGADKPPRPSVYPRNPTGNGTYVVPQPTRTTAHTETRHNPAGTTVPCYTSPLERAHNGQNGETAVVCAAEEKGRGNTVNTREDRDTTQSGSASSGRGGKPATAGVYTGNLTRLSIHGSSAA